MFHKVTLNKYIFIKTNILWEVNEHSENNAIISALGSQPVKTDEQIHKHV